MKSLGDKSENEESFNNNIAGESKRRRKRVV